MSSSKESSSKNLIKDSITKHYDKYSSDYDQKNAVAPQTIIDRLAFQKIRMYAAGKDVLEVGCGTGIWMQDLQLVVKSVTGIDLSVGMVQQAKQKGLKVKIGDAESLPFPDSSFDLLYSYRVLPHVLNLPQALAEMKRVLRPEGKAILMFYNKRSLKYFSRKKKMEEKVFTSFYSIKEILALDPSLKLIGGYKILPYPKKLPKIPGFDSAYTLAEKICSRSFLKRYGGNLLMEMSKRGEEKK